MTINNKMQTIKGVHIKNLRTFKNIRAVVEAEMMEGWKPTAQDIRELVQAYNTKDNDFEAKLKRLGVETVNE